MIVYSTPESVLGSLKGCAVTESFNSAACKRFSFRAIVKYPRARQVRDLRNHFSKLDYMTLMIKLYLSVA